METDFDPSKVSQDAEGIMFHPLPIAKDQLENGSELKEFKTSH